MDRVDAIRDMRDAGSLGLVLYLDLTPEQWEAWHTQQGWDVAVLGRTVSETLLALLLASGEVTTFTPIEDEAARALSLFIACGPDRQALAAPLIEGIHNTKPDGPNDVDPLAGFNKDESETLRFYRQRLGIVPHCVRCHRDRVEAQDGADEEIDASEAISEVERILEGPAEAAA